MGMSACLLYSSPRCRLPRPNLAPTQSQSQSQRETHTCEPRIHRKKEIKIENAGPADAPQMYATHTHIHEFVCMCAYFSALPLPATFCRALVFINKYFLAVANWPGFLLVFFFIFASFFLMKCERDREKAADTLHVAW